MKRFKRFLIAAALLALCLVGLLWVRHGLDTLERVMFPRKYADAVTQYASEFGVDEMLVYAIIRTESGFDSTATSAVGARGLMQITEETFAWLKTKIAPQEEITFDDLYLPEVNIRFGTYLLSVCMARYAGDVQTAAAAYHSGLGKVDTLLANSEYSNDGVTLRVFPYNQMNNYVHKVSRNYTIYQRLYT